MYLSLFVTRVTAVTWFLRMRPLAPQGRIPPARKRGRVGELKNVEGPLKY